MSEPTQLSKPLVISIMGPTASGKTALAIALREKLACEIISVDSAMVYRQMNIGTAKPTQEELTQAPHRLIDIRDPSEPYSAADFCKDASLEIRTLLAAKKTPLLVGGTMMYFKALLEGLSPMPEADAQIRADIEARAAAQGWPAIHEELAKVDPESAEKIHPNHAQRLSRALEVFLISGKPMSSFHEQQGTGLVHKYDWLQIVIAPQDRSVLHQRIEQRFDGMLADGFLAEVESLKNRGDLHKDLPAIRAVGYRQVWEFLDGEYDHHEMKQKAIAATRQLAKRQLTWLRRWLGAKWLKLEDDDGNLRSNDELVDDILKHCLKTVV